MGARQSCPHCRSTRTVPLVFGYPDVATQKLAEKGLLALGGCLVDVDEDDCVPSHRCLACGTESGKVKFDMTLDGPNGKSLAMVRTPEQRGELPEAKKS